MWIFGFSFFFLHSSELFTSKYYSKGIPSLSISDLTVQMISEVEQHDKLHWLFHRIRFFILVGAANTFSQSPCLNEYDSLRGYVFYSYLYIRNFHNAKA